MFLFHRILAAVAASAALTVLVLAARLEPDPSGVGTHRQLGLPACGYLEATGRPCLSCGMTTAFSHMAEAEPVAAVRANPMGLVLFLLTLCAVPWCAHAAWTGADPFRFVSWPRGRFLLPLVMLGLLALFLVRQFAAS